MKDFSNISGVIQQLFHKPHGLKRQEQKLIFFARLHVLSTDAYMTGQFMNCAIFRKIRLLLWIPLREKKRVSERERESE